MRRLLIIVFIIFVIATASDAQSALESRVRADIEQIRLTEGAVDVFFMQYQPAPISDLIALGMDAIPCLVPFASDESETRMVARSTHSRKLHTLPVSFFVSQVISKVTEHTFDGPKANDPDSVDIYKKQILAWWERNHSKTVHERKLEEVNDVSITNRLDAYYWLGKNKIAAARPLLEKRIEKLLTGGVDSSKQAEMAECANSLAEIGDPLSQPGVDKVCNHLSYWIYMTYRPSGQGRSASDSGQLNRLFMAYRAMAKLGQKEKAVSALIGIGNEYLFEMEESTQKEFLKKLEEAAGW